jgi:PKD repeat protein
MGLVLACAVVVLPAGAVSQGIAGIGYGSAADSGPLWNITTVDQNAGKSTSIAVDSAGRPHIVYVDPDRGALLYAWNDGTEWLIDTVDDDVPGDQATAIALDSTNRPHIAYTDMERGLLKYATSWDKATVGQVTPGCVALALDATGDPYIVYGPTKGGNPDHGLFIVACHDGVWGSPYAIDPDAYCTWCSLAIDTERNGFHIAYTNGESCMVRYAWADENGWHTRNIDDAYGISGAIALDSAGMPHIVYTGDAGALRYAWHDGAGWSETTVDTKAMYVSLAIDREDTAHIASCDGAGTLKYAWADEDEWQTMTVDSTLWPGLGYYCSIATDTAGHPYISYYDMRHDALRYAYGTFGEPAPAFTADFTALPVSGQAPLTVSFTDASRGDPTFRTYDFGDGFSSTAKNPVHTYRSPGTYTVTLTILKSGSGGLQKDTAIKQDLVTVGGGSGSGLAAGFTAAPVTGEAPLKVSFTDTSTGSPDYWTYDFGDGMTSSSKNPVHSYRRPGTYTVSLTVMKVEHGSLVRNTTVMQDLVTVE